MGPKTQQKLDELYEQYKAARARGEMGTAVRLLTRINEIEAMAKDAEPSQK